MLQVFDAEAVRGLLDDRGWSINELARRMDTEAVRVRGWLNGRHQPSVESLDRLAAALAVAPARLLKAVETPGPGSQGAVGMSPDEVLVILLVMRLIQEDPHHLAQAVLDKLPWKYREPLLREAVLPAGWEALWRRLQAKVPANPLWQQFQVQAQVVPPGRKRAAAVAPETR